MSLSTIVRNVRPLSAMFLLCAMAVRVDGQSPEPLFTDTPSTRAFDVAAPASAPEFVVRSRTADLQPVIVRRAIAAPATTSFVLNLFDDARLSLTFEHAEESSGDRTTWVGRIVDRPHSSVILTLSPAFVAGQIIDGTTVYNIAEHGTGVHRIDQLDTTRMPPARDDVLPVPPEAAAAALRQPAGDRLAAPAAAPSADVLVYYTPGVRARTGGAPQAAALAERLIAETNVAYRNSGITGRLRLIGVAEAPAPDGYSASILVNALRTHPFVTGQRNALGADLVALLTTHFDDPGLCGLAYIGPASEFAASVSSIAAGCYATFAHEIGHNLGGQHAPSDPGVLQGPQYPAYARGYKAPNHAFGTVMAYTCPVPGGCPRLLNFSNPNVTAPPPFAPGQPTGTAAQFNALRLHETLPAAAAYRAARVPPSAPRRLQANVSSSTVSLAWRPPLAGGSPTHYVLAAGRSPGTSNIVAGATVGDTGLIVSGVPPGQYFVRVHARNAGGLSAPSNEVMFTVGLTCQLPSAPQGFTYSKAGTTLNLAWAQPAIGGAASYILVAGSGPGATNLFNANIGNRTQFGGNIPAGMYFVRVFAVNGCGVGAASPELPIPIP